MPKRLVDGDALWRSDKLRTVKPSKFKAEYANLLPLALSNGAFECNPHKIWCDVYSYNRPEITAVIVTKVLTEFERVKLLYRWKDEEGKTWGFWTGIDKPGRLPPPSKSPEEEVDIPYKKIVDFLNGNHNGTGSVPTGNRVGTEPEGDRKTGLGLGLGVGSGLGSGSGLGRGVGKGNSKTSEADAPEPLDGEEILTDKPSVTEYRGIELQPERELLAWMRDAAGRAGKHWKHDGRRGNKGPIGKMKTELREKENTFHLVRPWWIDFLLDDVGDNEQYPYSAFLNGYYPMRLDKLTDEQSVREMEKENRPEPTHAFLEDLDQQASKEPKLSDLD